jgi:hypothetical protein
MELAHLAGYRAALVANRHQDDYVGDAEVGLNPPDFWIELREGGRVGLELTQLASKQRRDAESRTRVLLSAISARSEDFSRLDGWTIHLWRIVDGVPVMPKSFDRAALNELVGALAETDPRELRFAAPPDGWPDKLDLPRRELPSGYTFYTTEGSTGTARGPSRVRFDIAYYFQTDLQKDELVAELHRVVSQHDSDPLSDHLIVTIGGPDQDGLAYLTEFQILPTLLSPSPDPLAITDPTNLDRVRLYDWATGQIIELFERPQS